MLIIAQVLFMLIGHFFMLISARDASIHAYQLEKN
jgi:hypothetical protein